jgi:hypothetical protein
MQNDSSRTATAVKRCIFAKTKVECAVRKVLHFLHKATMFVSRQDISLKPATACQVTDK